ncbi:hypothetical protein N9M73_05175 [Rhodobacteraceae bacterium]|nr:hypothetical protein [Paracoccaceae bacterium]
MLNRAFKRGVNVASVLNSKVNMYYWKIEFVILMKLIEYEAHKILVENYTCLGGGNMRSWFVSLLAITLIGCFPMSISAEGNLASRATRLPDMIIDSAELTLSVSQFELQTGKYYRWRIIHDGGEEFQILAPDLFRNSWIGQVVIEELEVKPLGMHSVEFDDEGTIDIWFVPIRPGNFDFWIAGYESRGLAGKFVVR